MPHLERERKLDFADVLIRPKRSILASRSDVSLEREFPFRWSKLRRAFVPIVASNMDTLMVSSGTSDKDFEQLKGILTEKACEPIRMICLDIANGYSEHFATHVKKVRKEFPNHVIIAGNVVTGEMTEQLILSGADIVKVGIGPGSVCTTRKKTGVGYPQLSAVLECADAAHGIGGRIIADGGCTTPGDVAKAFGAGADFVMMGGMFSGHLESGGRVFEIDGEKFVEFYGMSSNRAQSKYGGVKKYRASEGKTVLVPYKGNVIDTINDILGGLRSACTYTGSLTLKQLPRRTTFIQVNRQLNNVYGQKDMTALVTRLEKQIMENDKK